MPVIKTKTTYLEMRSPPADRVASPADDVEIVDIATPSVDDYLTWYRSVGAAWLWTDRLQMESASLAKRLAEPGIVVKLLRVADQPAGFVELDLRNALDVEIVYFGLYPEFIGRGLGKFFLSEIIHSVWRHTPERLWLHTCDLDSPAALPNYRGAGFEVYEEKLVDKTVPASP